jgi:hypothetical protein
MLISTPGFEPRTEISLQMPGKKTIHQGISKNPSTLHNLFNFIDAISSKPNSE